MKKVIIGSLVRDRGWILPRFLDGVLGLDYPKDALELFFLVNDSTDDSWDILEAFRTKHFHEYKDITIMQISLGACKDLRSEKVRQEIIPHLAYLRNILLSKVGNNDYLFSVDCDIILSRLALTLLLAAEKDICAGVVNNHPQGWWPNVYDQWKREPVREYPQQQVFECDVTGAIILLSQAVCRKVIYAAHVDGEDVAFCNNARMMGFSVHVNSRVNACHILRKEDYEHEDAA